MEPPRLPVARGRHRCGKYQHSIGVWTGRGAGANQPGRGRPDNATRANPGADGGRRANYAGSHAYAGSGRCAHDRTSHDGRGAE